MLRLSVGRRNVFSFVALSSRSAARDIKKNDTNRLLYIQIEQAVRSIHNIMNYKFMNLQTYMGLQLNELA
jgi:hypothetical protein